MLIFISKNIKKRINSKQNLQSLEKYITICIIEISYNNEKGGVCT